MRKRSWEASQLLRTRERQHSICWSRTTSSRCIRPPRQCRYCHHPWMKLLMVVCFKMEALEWLDLNKICIKRGAKSVWPEWTARMGDQVDLVRGIVTGFHQRSPLIMQILCISRLEGEGEETTFLPITLSEYLERRGKRWCPTSIFLLQLECII